MEDHNILNQSLTRNRKAEGKRNLGTVSNSVQETSFSPRV